MERIVFHFDGGTNQRPSATAVLVGVVASGNLEVLVEPSARAGECSIEISTAARGFGSIWQAVMEDFFVRHRLGGVRISINDAGATPATVSLRMDQAAEVFIGSAAG